MKTIRTFLCIMALVLLTASCSKDYIPPLVNKPTIELIVRNAAGENLLDPSHPNTLMKDGKAKIYYMVKNNGVEKERLQENGYRFFTPEKYTDCPEPVIAIWPYVDERKEQPKENRCRTIVEWSNGEKDVFDVIYTKHYYPQTLYINDMLQESHTVEDDKRILQLVLVR